MLDSKGKLRQIGVKVRRAANGSVKSYFLCGIKRFIKRFKVFGTFFRV